MITELQIQSFLERPESSLLDFKEEMYNFKNDYEFKETAKFVKDVISFSNTIRVETGYILIGIRETKEFPHEIIGLKNSIDDSILQEKVKDKIFPRPMFSYYEIIIKDKRIGVLEFPITKYELPLTATLRMKGIELGKAYFRNGTSNTEANVIDTIRITDWLRSLSGSTTISLSEKISAVIKRLTKNDEKLSTILADVLQIAKEHRLNDIYNFAQSQIIGIDKSDSVNHLYRRQKLIISPLDIEINPYSMYNLTPTNLKTEMLQMEGFFEYKILFTWSIITIEEWIENYGDTRFGKMKQSAKQLLGEGDYQVNVFIFGEDLKSVCNNIRQKLLEKMVDM